jgi:hypothetical protein
MNTLSGLNDSVRMSVGRTLSMHLAYGWGWTLHLRGSSEAEPFGDIDAINLTSVRVVPSAFFAEGAASTRGFLGRVLQPGHLLHDWPVLAFTMSDGFDYDFTSRICPAWRFFFGEGELVCPPDSFPRLRGAKIIGGYGRVTVESPIPECPSPGATADRGGMERLPDG